ncbi:MAG: ATP-dependent DNA helicase RecG [Clostridiaceae bacterium]|jgi:ATP-dependent DNA helicase RecG|nr:ATP-dependent DNA helicase RecG [Clostridiaceae bacterium]
MQKGPELLDKPLQYLKGVGEARAALFRKLGIHTVGDVISHYPRNYEDRSMLKKIIQLQDGDQCSFEGIIASRVIVSRPRKGLSISKVSIRDDTGLVNAVWFNKPYLKDQLKPGEKYIFFGKVTRRGTFEVLNPVYEKVDETGPVNTCRIIPIYPSTGKLTQNVIRTVIRNALGYAGNCIEDIMPAWVRERYDLAGALYSINNIHFPESDDAFLKARERLVFEELLVLQLALMSVRNAHENAVPGITFGAREEVRSFVEGLPFRLTNAQLRVLEEIERDMESSRVMNRLVQGDVGSGKTIVATAALVKAVKSGYQGAFMVPTEILAAQHYSSLRELLEPLGVNVALLTGSVGAKESRRILEGLASGEIDIAVGTHALIEERVVFDNLGLVITDEQHRFGVRQRAALGRKGTSPDMLVMTATPIPRTLALILYGDLDISIIDELPPGRKKVLTYAVDSSMRERVYNFIRKQVKEGRQVYIVCPLVEESETVDAVSASELAFRLATKTFSDLRVGLIHGRMKPAEKDEVMKSFISGETDILVSTTVIEVGVNVPNATLMVIENAERFGLSQLHQLRGRVGRGSHQSYCILFNDSRSEIASERMKVMTETHDGFVISEKDLELRGPGDFFGTRQHGIPDLKIANLYRDMDILKKAQEAAEIIISNDRLLETPENRLLGQVVRDRYSRVMKTITMN